MNEIIILPFGSGSTGNSVYIEIGPYHLLVDMGIGFRKIRDTLFLYDRDISSIEAIFITHGHYDHIKSAKRRNKLKNTQIKNNGRSQFKMDPVKQTREKSTLSR